MLFRCWFGSCFCLVAVSVIAQGHACGPGCDGRSADGDSPDVYQREVIPPGALQRPDAFQSRANRPYPSEAYARQMTPGFRRMMPANPYGGAVVRDNPMRYRGQGAGGYSHGALSHREYPREGYSAYGRSRRDEQRGYASRGLDRRVPGSRVPDSRGASPRDQQDPQARQPMIPRSQPPGMEDLAPIMPPSLPSTLPPTARDRQRMNRPPSYPTPELFRDLEAEPEMWNI